MNAHYTQKLKETDEEDDDEEKQKFLSLYVELPSIE